MTLLTERQYIDIVFSERWIGRRVPIERPPRSPDLTLGREGRNSGKGIWNTGKKDHG